MADIAPSTLGRIDKGEVSPRLEQLERVAAALEIEVAQLFEVVRE